MTRGPKPTVAPRLVLLLIAPIPPAPPGSTESERMRWQKLHHFRNQINAIRARLRSLGTREWLNEITWLYYNQYIAGEKVDGDEVDGDEDDEDTVHPYKTQESLFSRQVPELPLYSRGFVAQDNAHLATIGLGPVKTRGEASRLWNEYLRAHDLPEVDHVGIGLPVALRSRGGSAQAMAAAAPAHTMTGGSSAVAAAEGIPPTAGGRQPQAPRVHIRTAAGTTGSSSVGVGGAGPSTAAFRAAVRDTAVARPGPSASDTSAPIDNRRRAENTLMNTAADGDNELLMAVQFRRESLPNNAGESNSDAITRLAGQFLDFVPGASARDAITRLAREGWDVMDAINRWYSNRDDNLADAEEADDRDNEGQPPRKKQRRHNADDDDDGEGEADGGSKGKGKSKDKGKGKGEEYSRG